MNFEFFPSSGRRGKRLVMYLYTYVYMYIYINVVVDVKYRPFRNSSGNWGEFQILTNR